VTALIDRCTQHTRHYRPWRGSSFSELPTVSRADLATKLADFVPDDVDLSRVVQGTSSGSTGSTLILPLHPVEISRDIVLFEHLLDALGVAWPYDLDRFALLSVVDQLQAFTYASPMTYRNEQMMARVNLDQRAWRRPGDREDFLNEANPQVITGTALSLLRLAELETSIRPLALISGAVQLTSAARSTVSARFGVPLLDLYGLKETGPVAVSVDGGPHVVVPRRVHVEVVDDDGSPLPDGSRGELTVTVDGNPYLPLLRYRTGDTGILEHRDGRQYIHDLDGRLPVSFRAADGRAVPSVDLTQHLQHFGALAWAVHQRRDALVEARIHGGDRAGIERALRSHLGDIVTVTAVDGPAELGPGKPRRYSTDR
jgi:phenylacetate-CoA ligase